MIIFITISLLYQQLMHKPLSLFPRRTQKTNEDISNATSIYKRADSLQFSRTSEKHSSNIQSICLKEKKDSCKDLQTLQLKLSELSMKMLPSTFQDYHQVPLNSKSSKHKKLDNNSTQQYFKKPNSQDKQNHEFNKVGKIVHKRANSNFNRTKSRKDKSQVYTSFSRNSLLSQTQLFMKTRQLSKLKNEVQVIRHSLQKSQKSKSLCSQRLSASKLMIKNLKEQYKKQQSIIKKLKSDIKKSQTIRQKQKGIILTQKRQLQKCRDLLRPNKQIR